jgi:subtilisin family serine protease
MTTGSRKERRAMRKLALIPILALAIAGCEDTTRPGIEEPLSQREARIVPNQYIIVFTDEVTDPPGVARGIVVAHGLRLRHTYSRALRGFAAVVPPGRVDALRADSRVRYVTADRIDELHQQAVLPTGVDRIEADRNAGAGDPVDADVAILDTGIDLDHPDLNVHMAVSFAGGKGDDGYGHGTHVAGTVAAKDDGIGVVGVAPGARLWAVKVCKNNGSCLRSDIIAGIDFVAANAAEIEVANMSLGGGGWDDGACGVNNNDAEHEAICNAVDAGVVFVVSAGNSMADAENYVPASYDEVITVSALADFDGQPGGTAASTCRNDQDDSFADLSNYGADVDVMAPGVCIESTWKQGGTNTISGTSMAAPHVTGVVALYVAQHYPNGLSSRAEVESVKSDVLGAAIPQTDAACGLAEFDDPDGIPEGIVFANALNVGGDGTCGGAPPPAGTDVAITSVSAPVTANPGAVIDVRVTVQNVGGEDVTSDISVDLVSDNATTATDDDIAIGNETIVGGLAAGQSTELPFSWNTAGSNTGGHTLTASHGFSDDDPTNDSQTASVTLGATVHVGNLDRASTKQGRGKWKAWVRITVHDADHAVLGDAQVMGTWDNDGVTQPDECTTDGSGMCEVSYPQIPNSDGSILFTVDDVSLGEFPYDAPANHDPDRNSDGTTIRVHFSNSDDYKKGG